MDEKEPHVTVSRPRARQLGITLRGTPGPLNAITDVAGVEVGYATLITVKGSSRWARVRSAPG